VAIGDSEARSIGVASRAGIRAALFSGMGLILLIGLLWFAGLEHVLAVLRGADPALIGVAVFLIVIATLLGAINSYMVAAADTGVRFLPYLGVYWLTWALGQVVPGQVGDLIGMGVFLRRRGLALPTAVGRLGVDKLISLFCTLALSAGLIAIFDAPLPRIAGFLGAGIAALLLIAFLFALRWPAIGSYGDGWRAQLMSGLREAHRVATTRPHIVLLDGLLTIFMLLAIGICYWVVLRALHSNTNGLVDVTIMANSAGLIAYVPLSANGIGTVETGSLYLFGLRGVSAPLVLATYLILRFANLLLAWGGAIFVLTLSRCRRPTPP
jgi:uncharacterized membrane protein YbhN (UPF0104 family)